MRPIDADTLLKKCIEGDGDDEFTEGYNCAVQEISAEIDDMPTLDYAPLVHAHWMLFEKDEFGNIFQCSKCGKPQTTESFEDYPDVNFCSDCGAKMDEKDGEKQ